VGLLMPLFILYSSTCHSQTPSFLEIMALENNTLEEIEHFLITKGFSFIEKEKSYQYTKSAPCTPPKLAADSCQWICTTSVEHYFSDWPLTEIPFESGPSVFYRERENIECLFAFNYDYNKETAFSFITLKKYREVENNNCLGEFGCRENRMGVYIQFNNKEEFNEFMGELLSRAHFLEATQNAYSAPTIYYGICRVPDYSNEQPFCKGVGFAITEQNEFASVHVTFNTYVDTFLK
jgi:hypothetical protein